MGTPSGFVSSGGLILPHLHGGGRHGNGYPRIRDWSTVSQASHTSAFYGVMPRYRAGDLLIGIDNVRRPSYGAITSISSAAGWTLLSSVGYNTVSHRIGYRWANGDDHVWPVIHANSSHTAINIYSVAGVKEGITEYVTRISTGQDPGCATNALTDGGGGIFFATGSREYTMDEYGYGNVGNYGYTGTLGWIFAHKERGYGRATYPSTDYGTGSSRYWATTAWMVR